MKLEITGKDYGEPTLELITKAVHDLEFPGEFFILIREDESFLQALVPNDKLHIEFFDAGTQEHLYYASSITSGELVEFCMNYINESEGWNKADDWRPLEEWDPGSNATWSISGL